ncbi:MAG: ABC transporter substrate-binding protein [Rhodospirillales bacterium]
MTAPALSSLTLLRERETAAALRIGLERVLHPGHLALAAVRAASGNAALILQTPEADFDGFTALRARECDLVVARPLALLEPSAANVEAIGCIFASLGGVLVREDRLGKLRGGEVLLVATSVARPLADGLCRRVLQGWAGNQGFAVAETQVVIEEVAGHQPADVLRDGFDAAWLAYAPIDALAAARRGLAVRLVTAEDAGLPPFAALELVARKDRPAEEVARHEALLADLEQAALRLTADPEGAVALWRSASGDSSETAAAMVRAALPFLQTRIERRPLYRQALRELFEDV